MKAITRIVDKKQVFYHDVFNVFYLLFVIYVDSQYLCQSFGAFGVPQAKNEEEEMANVRLVLKVFSLYLVVDTLWVAVLPSCIPSKPIEIIGHHCVTLLYVYFPWYYREFGVPCACDCLVEINTLCIVLRRNVPEGGILKKFFEIGFLLTWVFFRLVLFPYVLYSTFSQYLSYSAAVGSFRNVMVMGPVFQGVLTIMGLYWTALLVANSKKRAKQKVELMKSL